MESGAPAAHTPGRETLPQGGESGPAIARAGVRGAGQPLPFLERIQAAFGHHDVRGVQAHLDAAAARAAQAIGARAYALGEHIAFAGSPDVHTAAHEAAHVVQQRGGVALAGEMGAPGDAYEAHADRVAAAVVAGASAEALLDERVGAAAGPQRQAVQCAGAERAVVGRPSATAPYIDAPPGTTDRSVGVTKGDTVRVRVTGSAGGTLKARVTTGAPFVQVGATADALGVECTIADNILFVKGVASNEALQKALCEITLLENEAPIGKLQPKVYDSVALPIHAWKVTYSATEDVDPGGYQGMPVYGEELSIPSVIEDVAATWRAAGIAIALAETTTLHVRAPRSANRHDMIEAGLKANPAFKVGNAQMHLVFVPIYERFGLACSRYSRDEVDPSKVTKDPSRERGFGGPVAFIGVNGSIGTNGDWASRSRAISPLGGEDPVLGPGDKAFHMQSLSSDTAHELGHLLGLPHVDPAKTAPKANILTNATSSHQFGQLMHSQVATPMSGYDNEQHRAAADIRLGTSAHPKSATGGLTTKQNTTYQTQRGALITDDFAQIARSSIRTGQAFGQSVEDERTPKPPQRPRIEPTVVTVLVGTVYEGGASDLRNAVFDILEDAELDDYVPDVYGALSKPCASPSVLESTIAYHLPKGRESVAKRLAEYLLESSSKVDVQLAGGGSGAEVSAAAAQGTSGPAGRLPFLDRIQSAFGRHDVRGVQAHTDGNAAAGARAMGAKAFATGRSVAFAGAPDLHTAAHEAAHTVQQQSGVALAGGVGRAGDPYEQHADAVADRVVAGQSAEALLDAHAGTGGAPGVQRKPSDVAAFSVTKTGGLASVGPALTSDLQVAAIFAEVFPGKSIAQLPALIGLAGIALCGADAEKETTVTFERHAGARIEVTVAHPFFHHMLNEIRWNHDSATPEPSLFLHKWERNLAGGGDQKGAGTKVFTSVHAAATTLGIGAIMCDAIGDPQSGLNPENGYYTWARYGFNNQLTSEHVKFRERLGGLRAELAQLPELEVQVGAERATLVERGENMDEIDAEEHGVIWRRNMKTQGGYFTETDTMVLDYLELVEHLKWLRPHNAKLAGPLAWYDANAADAASPHELFLAADSKGNRAAAAELWRALGSTMMEAGFDLDPGSDSNKIFARYQADLT
ncbi:MAG TPA: DUF4157 domain-containing protein [Kofleriaceae bacterium]